METEKKKSRVCNQVIFVFYFGLFVFIVCALQNAVGTLFSLKLIFYQACTVFADDDRSERNDELDNVLHRQFVIAVLSERIRK